MKNRFISALVAMTTLCTFALLNGSTALAWGWSKKKAEPTKLWPTQDQTVNAAFEKQYQECKERALSSFDQLLSAELDRSGIKMLPINNAKSVFEFSSSGIKRKVDRENGITEVITTPLLLAKNSITANAYTQIEISSEVFPHESEIITVDKEKDELGNILKPGKRMKRTIYDIFFSAKPTSVINSNSNEVVMHSERYSGTQLSADIEQARLRCKLINAPTCAEQSSLMAIYRLSQNNGCYLELPILTEVESDPAEHASMDDPKVTQSRRATNAPLRAEVSSPASDSTVHDAR